MWEPWSPRDDIHPSCHREHESTKGATFPKAIESRLKMTPSGEMGQIPRHNSLENWKIILSLYWIQTWKMHRAIKRRTSHHQTRPLTMVRLMNTGPAVLGGKQNPRTELEGPCLACGERP